MDTEIFTSETESGLRKHRFLRILIVLALLVALFLIFSLHRLEQPPYGFPVDTDVQIKEGMTVSSVSDLLKAEGFVRSGVYFYITFQLRLKDSIVQAGSYRFPHQLTVTELGNAIANGEYSSPLISITFPEGFRVKDMEKILPVSYRNDIEKAAREYEGYLFPDTYFIEEDMPLPDLIAMMRDNYSEKKKSLSDLFASSTLSEQEIITLASILEREGKTPESMKLIAGILLNRLELEMPLQVDATLDYLLDKTSAELTTDDLALDSPYNTYLYRGIPPTPIANPGLEAIRAVLIPTPSEYLYYLTGSDGTFHYAKTFEEHKLNKARYLE